MRYVMRSEPLAGIVQDMPALRIARPPQIAEELQFPHGLGTSVGLEPARAQARRERMPLAPPSRVEGPPATPSRAD